MLLEARYMLTLPLIGMFSLRISSVLLSQLSAQTSEALLLIVAALLGLGAGLTVSPG